MEQALGSYSVGNGLARAGCERGPGGWGGEGGCRASCTCSPVAHLPDPAGLQGSRPWTHTHTTGQVETHAGRDRDGELPTRSEHAHR
jgi:hypothetical protein